MSRVFLTTVAFAFALVALWSDALVGGSPGVGPAQALLWVGSAGFFALLWAPEEWRRRTLLVTGSILAICLLFEAGLRILLPTPTRAYGPHPRYLHSLLPGATSRFQRLPQNGGQRIEMQVNSQGFRGGELRRGVKPRLIVYGDSFIQAEFSTQESTFVAQLERRLASRFPQIEVINAGVVSYGPDQELLRMEDDLPRLRPDLVLVALFAGNDYGDLIRNKLFRMEGDQVRQMPVELAPELRARFTRQRPRLRTFELLQKGIGLVRRDSEETPSIEDPPSVFPIPNAIEVYRARNVLEYAGYVNRPLVVTNLRYDYYDADLAVSPDSASARLKVALLRGVAARLHDVAVEHDVTLAILVIPCAVDVCDHYDEGWIDPALYPRYDPERLTRTMVQIADSLDIPCLDLYGPFRNTGADRWFFHGGDSHWNDAGQAAAAELTAHFFLSDSTLRGSVFQPNSH